MFITTKSSMSEVTIIDCIVARSERDLITLLKDYDSTSKTTAFIVLIKSLESDLSDKQH